MNLFCPLRILWILYLPMIGSAIWTADSYWNSRYGSEPGFVQYTAGSLFQTGSVDVWTIVHNTKKNKFDLYVKYSKLLSSLLNHYPNEIEISIGER